uniref:Uncharacterized protein n=1 Tax=Glossina austeni TaxID=7395 RepID=A0A1A9VSK0_GLOAU
MPKKLQARFNSERNKGRLTTYKKLAGLTMVTCSKNRREFELEELPFGVRQRVKQTLDEMEAHQKTRGKRLERLRFHWTRKFRLILNPYGRRRVVELIPKHPQSIQKTKNRFQDNSNNLGDKRVFENAS